MPNVTRILLIVPKLLLFLGNNFTARDVLRAVLTEESVENVSDFIAQPEERPDFCLSCLSGPTLSTDSLQPPPFEGSSQPATRHASPPSLSDSDSLENGSTLISCISQSTPIAKATAISRLTCQKLYTANEVLEQVINGSDIELGDYYDEEIDGPFENKEDYQLPLDVQGEIDFESSSSDDDEPEVSSHSTAPLYPKKCKNCYLALKGIWSTGWPMAP